MNLGSGVVSSWTYAESGSFALTAGDTVKGGISFFIHLCRTGY